MDEIEEESCSHDCPVGGISLRVLSREEAKREDMENKTEQMTENEQELRDMLLPKLLTLTELCYNNSVSRKEREGLIDGVIEDFSSSLKAGWVKKVKDES